MLTAAAWLLLCAPGPDEEVRLREGEARYLASDARSRCRELLADLDGVGGVNVAGTGTDYRLILVVRDLRTQAIVRERIRGDAFDGLRVLWCVSNPAAQPLSPYPAPAPAAAAPFAAPALRAPAIPVSAPTACPTPPTSFRRLPAAPVEMRRTFYAGPAVLTPTRRYDGSYSRYSNCSPSRYGMIGGGYCPPRACSTPYAYTGGGSSCGRTPPPAPTCGTRPGLAVGQNRDCSRPAPPVCGGNRPGVGRPASAHGRPAVGGLRGR